MTVISDDPSGWSTISYFRGYSYFTVAATTILVYDWTITLTQEIELIWQQRWSPMTILYLSVRYIGIPYSLYAFMAHNLVHAYHSFTNSIYIIESVPTISVTDIGCLRLYSVATFMVTCINAMLGVIIITRLYAMYQRSRKVLVFLITIFLVTVINGIVTASIEMHHISAEEYILSGQHLCGYGYDGAAILLSETWIINTVWEVNALGLSIWIAVKHFSELRQQSSGQIAKDVFMALLQSHIFYFMSLAAVSCLTLGILSPRIANSASVGTEMYTGILQIAQTMQMFILGPRLILSVRGFNAKLVDQSDEGATMSTVAFGERIQQELGSDV